MFLRLCAAAAAIALGIQTASVAWGEILAADAGRVGGLIVSGKAVDPAVSKGLATRLAGEQATLSCTRWMVDAEHAVVMANFDSNSIAADYGAWATAVGDGERVLQRLLTCSPGNGVLWGLFAEMKQAAAPEDPVVAAALELSQAFAPSQDAALEQRFRLWQQAVERSSLARSSTLKRDVLTLLEWGNLGLVKRLLGGSSSVLKQEANAAMAFVDPERREALGTAGIGVVAQ